ncbi:MAG: patatin-like phospholipase family protein [bacterium]|nr:patatin-like phospholipase family protein [Candidatus Sumerlaeota bacterium]
MLDLHIIRKRGLLYLAGLIITLAVAGCVVIGDSLDQARIHFATIPYFVFDNAPGYQKPAQRPVFNKDINLAVAISGGGMRSAVFASGVLEQLACMPDPHDPSRMLLDRCDAISGVSGGSLAAAYYGLYKPARLSNRQERDAFFQRFKSNMSTDFLLRNTQHYISHPWEAAMKYYTRYRFTNSLANTYDQYLFRGATFSQLNQREASGESPAIIINAASLDTGMKFLFTNLNVREHFSVDPRTLIPRLPAIVTPNDLRGMETLAKLSAIPTFQALGFDGIDSDISSFRLASAIVASSAQPILPGPATLINYAVRGYVHLADGAINDNLGVDSIIELYLNRIQNSGKPRQLVIISIDASGGKTINKTGDPNGYVGALSYAEKAFISLSKRSLSFSTMVYNSLDAIKFIHLRFGDSPRSNNLTNMSTMAYISETDFHTVLGAASDVVNLNRERIESALKR